MTDSPPSKRLRRTIDDDEDIAYLESLRKITPTTNAGYRSLSVNAYSPLSSQSSTTTIEIPEVIASTQTLELAGFTPSVAQEVFRRWETLCAKYPEGDLSLDKSARDYIDNKAHVLDAYKPGDDYEAAWLAMGFDPDRARRLVAPEHETMRLMLSASDEFKESVRDVFEHLYSLSRKVKNQKRLLGLRNVSDVTPQVQTEVALPTNIDDHTMLYKGATMDRLERVWPDSDSNNIKFQMLSSRPPTDFHRTRIDILYFPKELQTAEKYCSYKSNRTPFCRLGILHIAVPNHLVANTNVEWIFDPSWRRLIWESRGPLAYDEALPEWELSADLETYFCKDGLAGKISHTNNDQMAGLPDASYIGEMTLRGGVKATQYAFFRKAYTKLNTECKGKIWIEERETKPNGDTQQSSGVGIHRA